MSKEPGFWKRHFHKCRGNAISVSYFTVNSIKAFGEDVGNEGIGTNTRVLFECNICGKLFINTYPGKWTLEEIKNK